MSSVPHRFRRLGGTALLGVRVPIATSFPSRFLGLAFLDRRRAGSGLLLPRCRSIHTFGMRFPLDLVFLDAEQQVIELRREVRPFRIVRCSGASAVLEIPSPD